MTAPAGYVNIFLMACMWLAEDLFVQPVREVEQGRVLLHPQLHSARRGDGRGAGGKCHRNPDGMDGVCWGERGAGRGREEIGSWVPSSTPSPNLPRVLECSTACQRQESDRLRWWYLQRERAFPAIIAAFLRRNKRVYAGGRGWGGRALSPWHGLGHGHLPSRPPLLQVPVVLENVPLSLSCSVLVATSPGVPEAGPQQLHLSLYLGGKLKIWLSV